MARCRMSLSLPSISCVEFHLFLIMTFIISFSVPLVSLGVTTWSCSVFLFLDFHMDHIVIETKIRSLSESLVRSSLKDRAAMPLVQNFCQKLFLLVTGYCSQDNIFIVTQRTSILVQAMNRRLYNNANGLRSVGSGRALASPPELVLSPYERRWSLL